MSDAADVTVNKTRRPNKTVHPDMTRLCTIDNIFFSIWQQLFLLLFQVALYFFQKQFQIDKITLHTAGRFDTRRLIQFSSLQKMVEIFGFILFKSRDGHRPLRHTVHHCDKKLWNFVVGTRESEHCCLLLSVAPQHSKFLTGWHRLLGPWLCW